MARTTLSRIVALAFVWLAICATSQSAKIQKHGLTQSELSKARAEEICASYRDAYGDYLQYAKGHDELLPISKSGEDPLGGWGASIVDSLSTSYLMGHMDLFNSGVKFMKTVDFTRTSQQTISLFETNIRYLGGLLSAYELGGKKEPKLVDQARIVGDHLLTGWVGDNKLPLNTLRWNNYGSPQANKGHSGIAEAGTLLLEMDRLSKYTGDRRYVTKARQSMLAIVNSKVQFPGLFPQVYTASTGQPADDYITWGGGSDSFFEYLIKYGYLTGDDQSPWIPTWVNSIMSSIRHLIQTPEQTSANFTYLTDYSETDGGNLPRFSHLGCFAGGNWILGAKMLDNDKFLEYGLALTEGCANTYRSSPSGIGPESFVFVGRDGNINGVTINDRPFYAKHGFDFEVTQYVLRPEVIESIFYAYRTTGDPYWQELAWSAWTSIKKHCKAPAAFAAIDQVNSTAPALLDDSESFLYAELFKYMYLIFADPAVASLDEYVFNTEAHPFKIDNPDKIYSATIGDILEPLSKVQSHVVDPPGFVLQTRQRASRSGLNK